MRILDRYVLRNFLEPFLLCFFGLIAIWLVYDLYDNGPDFVEYHVPLKTIGRFYLSQLPAITLLSLPIALLLALLFSLSKMSRHNEIISMLTAGRSLERMLVPLTMVGIICTGVCFVLNSTWAPHADAVKKRMLEEITRGEKRATEREAVEGHLFRDRMNNRTWFVRKLRPPRSRSAGVYQLEGVQVIQQDANGVIQKKWYANQKAVFDETAKTWTFYKGMIVEFNKEGDITFTDNFPEGERVIKDWTETPWRIASSQFDPQNLSIEELKIYLANNFDFPPPQLAPYRTNLFDRWAFPWSCLVVVFISAPLGIVYSRRGVLAGVAGSIFLFFGLILLRYLFLAFGKGSRLDPALAAWLPNVFFFAVGLILLYYRSTNRDLPKLAFWK